MTSHIKGFFDKFLNLDKDRTSLKKLFIGSVKTSCGIELTESQIIIQDNKIIVSGTPALKSELFINKNKILNAYNKTAVRKISTIV